MDKIVKAFDVVKLPYLKQTGNRQLLLRWSEGRSTPYTVAEVAVVYVFILIIDNLCVGTIPGWYDICSAVIVR